MSHTFEISLQNLRKVLASAPAKLVLGVGVRKFGQRAPTRSHIADDRASGVIGSVYTAAPAGSLSGCRETQTDGRAKTQPKGGSQSAENSPRKRGCFP
jgi:hypothetical protein